MICPTCKGERAVYRSFQNRITLTPCPKCNGVGEIVHTNFDRITDSPEALAEWLGENVDYCQTMWYWACDKCTWSKKHESCMNDKVKWLEWLNEESES